MNNIFLSVKAIAGNAKSEFDRLTNSLRKTQKSLKDSEKRAKDAEKGYSKLYNQIRKNNNSFSNMTKDANRANASLASLNKSFGSLSKVLNLNTATLYLLGRGLATSINSSLDMIETVNLFNVAMGDLAVETQKFVDNMSDAFGLDPTNMQNSVATYNLLARSMGMASDNAKVLSTNTSKLALDLSSLTNVPINQVMADLRSGLLGQSETVYKYGIDVTEASLKQEAMLQGITKSVRNMSQGEKMALRYAVMIRQTGLAHGDFAKTIETPSNQLRILAERFATLTRNIGSVFVPLLGKILPYLNAVVMVLNKIVSAIAKLVGYEEPKIENTTGGFSGIEDGADDATDAIDGTTNALKRLNNFGSGMDELNVISPEAESGGVGASVGGMDIDLDGYDNLMDGVMQKSDLIAQSIENMLGKFVKFSKFDTISIDNIKVSFSELWEVLKLLGGNIGDGLAYWYQNVLIPLNQWAIESLFPSVLDLITATLTLLNELLITASPNMKSFIDDTLVPMGSFTGDNIIKALSKLTDLIKKFTDYVKENREDVAKWLAVIGTIGVTIGTLLVILPTVINVIMFLVDVFKGLSAIVTIVNTVIGFLTSPIALVVAGLALLVGAITYVTLTSEEFQTKILPIVDGIKEAFFNLIDMVQRLWTDAFKPVIDNIVKKAKDFWDKSLKPLFENIGLLIADLVILILALFNDVLKPLIDWFIDNVVPNIVKAINFAVDAFFNVFTIVTDVVNGLFTVLRGLMQFITGVFTGDWSKAWEGIKNIFKGVFDSFVGLIKSPLNMVIDTVNKMIRSVISKLNELIQSAIRVASKVGIHIEFTPIEAPQIPRLARGGSLQAGQIFEAGEFGKSEIIGNYNGKTTVMPLEDSGFVNAMYNAVYDAVSNAQGSSEPIIENIMYLEDEVVYRSNQRATKRRGVNFALGGFDR